MSVKEVVQSGFEAGLMEAASSRISKMPKREFDEECRSWGMDPELFKAFLAEAKKKGFRGKLTKGDHMVTLDDGRRMPSKLAAYLIKYRFGMQGED